MATMVSSCVKPFVLDGSPDDYISTPEAKTKAAQVMQVSMPTGMVDQMLECVRQGKAPHVLFGKKPTLRFSGRTYKFDIKETKFRSELYSTAGEGTLAFAGLINHSAVVYGDVSSAENALDKLKSNVAAAEKERAHKTAGSTQVGPNKSPTTTKSLMAMQRAIRVSLAHFLAIKPASATECTKTLRASRSVIDSMLNKIAKPSTDGMGKFQLIEKFYKDLDVWKFSYKEEDRESAIENARFAFDRLRLEPDDKLWQMLLPKEKRGKGIVLSRSRVNLALPPAEAAKISTPSALPRIVKGKGGMPKRVEAKKTDGPKEAVKEKKANGAGARGKAGEGKASGETKVKSIAASKPKGTAAATSQSAKSVVKKQAGKDGLSRPSAAVKGMLNKPKNPSPLSTSPPVNASDFDHDHPVHKRLSGSPSPKHSPDKNMEKQSGKGLKRKAGDEGATSRPVKKLQLDPTKSKHPTVTNGSKAIKSTPSMPPTPTNGLKRKADREATTPTSLKGGRADTQGTLSKQRKLTNGDKFSGTVSSARSTAAKIATSGGPVRNLGHERNTSSASDGSSDSQPLALSWRQLMDQGEKFKLYYPRYEKLYKELASSPTPPTEAQRKDLMRMHVALADMKKQIENQSLMS